MLVSSCGVPVRAQSLLLALHSPSLASLLGEVREGDRGVSLPLSLPQVKGLMGLLQGQLGPVGREVVEAARLLGVSLPAGDSIRGIEVKEEGQRQNQVVGNSPQFADKVLKENILKVDITKNVEVAESRRDKNPQLVNNAEVIPFQKMTMKEAAALLGGMTHHSREDKLKLDMTEDTNGLEQMDMAQTDMTDSSDDGESTNDEADQIDTFNLPEKKPKHMGQKDQDGYYAE